MQGGSKRTALAAGICALCTPLAATPLSAQTQDGGSDLASESGDAASLLLSAPAASVPPPPEEPDKPAVKTRVLFSQFADMPVSGDAAETLRYGGKIDAYFDVAGSTLGVDDSWSLHIHPEFKYGESANGEIGLLPSNTQMFYPGEGEVFDLNVNVTKRWQSGTSLTVGKVNVLDLAAQLPVVGGGGHEGFQNLAMALPPSAIVPGSITGALLNVPTKKALYRLWVFDPDLQSERTGFETGFESGVAFLGSVTLPVKIGGKPGYYALKMAGSTRSEIAAEALPPALVPAPGSAFGGRKGEFSAVLAGYQFIELYPEAPGKGWGIFGQIYVSNGDPTFLDKSGFIGFSGNPRSRPQDRFGAAWFRYSLTDRLVDVLSGRLALEDEEGVEYFYTLGLSDQFSVTANVQVVDSAVAARDAGVLAGLRLTAKF
ncbi:porin [Altererythrobacter xiamenensis]|uniref:Porin n=1 Tax=Altererythrobacter xiamenensis TaxID=1316679 RepID=A0A1Y6F5I7_9SPHN|nr:porin [Altererythrobacter xiamenensis]